MSHDDPSQACLCLWVEGEQLLRWSWSSYNTNRPHALSAPPAHVSEVFLAVLRPFLFFSRLYLFTGHQFINFINIQSLDSLHAAHVTTTNLNASAWAFIWDQHKAAHNCEVEEKLYKVFKLKVWRAFVFKPNTSTAGAVWWDVSPALHVYRLQHKIAPVQSDWMESVCKSRLRFSAGFRSGLWLGQHMRPLRCSSASPWPCM